MARTVKKPDVRREEIVKAARTLFQTKAYDNTSMQDLMAVLNIAKGTIYHYFASKEALLEAVVDDLIDEELGKKEALMNSDDVRHHDALHKLRILITSDRMAEEHDQILDALHQSNNPKMHVWQLGRYLTKLAPIYAAVVAEGCEQGIFTTAHPLECAEFILAGIQFLTDVGIYPWSAKQLARRMAALPALIEAQLGAPEGSFNFLVE